MANNKKQNNPTRIEGWLALFTVGLIAALLRTIYHLFTDSPLTAPEIETFNKYQAGLGDILETVELFEVIIIVLAIALMSTTLVLILKKRKIAKRLAIITLLFLAVDGLSIYLIVSLIAKLSSLPEIMSTQAGITMVRNILAACIWIPYFMVSKRVKSTLIRTKGDGTDTHAISQEAVEKVRGRPQANQQLALTIAIALVILVITLGFSAFVTGGQFFKWRTKVVQEKKPETFRQENTGNYNINYTQRQICGGGEDYLSCVNSHVTLYNSICVGKSLTDGAESTCASLLDFIHDVQNRSATCGYGCVTQVADDGLWGWPYLELEPETRQVSNNDGASEITRPSLCFVKIGTVAIGECDEK